MGRFNRGNLERILDVVKAIGNILVIIDEGDRAFGNQGGDGDGGSSRSSPGLRNL